MRGCGAPATAGRTASRTPGTRGRRASRQCVAAFAGPRPPSPSTTGRARAGSFRRPADRVQREHLLPVRQRREPRVPPDPRVELPVSTERAHGVVARRSSAREGSTGGRRGGGALRPGGARRQLLLHRTGRGARQIRGHATDLAARLHGGTRRPARERPATRLARQIHGGRPRRRAPLGIRRRVKIRLGVRTRRPISDRRARTQSTAIVGALDRCC